MSISTSLRRSWVEISNRVDKWSYFGQDPAGVAQTVDALNGEALMGLKNANNPSGYTPQTVPSQALGMIRVNSSDQVELPNGAFIPAGFSINTATGTVGLSATVTLTAAQIITLHSVPVVLIAAPGAGKALVVNQLVFEMTTTATQFTGGGVVGPVYHGATTVITGNTVPAATVTTTAGSSNTLLSLGAVANGLVLSSNTGVDLYAGTADFAVGTGTAKVIVFYSVITL